MNTRRKVERVTVRRVPGTASTGNSEPRISVGPLAAELANLNGLADQVISQCVSKPWQPAAAALKQAAMLAMLAGMQEGTKRVS